MKTVKRRRPLTLHERIENFKRRPDWVKQLRHNAAVAYHPDHLPDELKEQGGRILADLNDVCDRYERD